MTKPRSIVVLVACLLINTVAPAQDSSDRISNVLSFPTRFLEKVTKRSSRLEEDIFDKSEKLLQQLTREEKRLQKKLRKKDAQKAQQLFCDAQNQYQLLQSELTNKASKYAERITYVPFLDTITTTLHYLQKRTSSITNNEQLQKSLNSINNMQSRFQQAAQIQQYIRNRREYLKEQLAKYDLTNALRGYSKKIYYYQAQIEEYKTILKQPDKIERKAIDLLSKTKPFQDFMQKFSVLGSLFPAQNTSAFTGAGLSGMQTSAQVNNLIQQTAGPNNLQALQSTIQQAQSQIQQLKSKISEKGGSSDAELPNFRPNSQRVKTFWSRLEYSTNLQSAHSNTWLPSTTDLGLSAGFKLNDRSVIGVGVSGRVGWGKDIKHVSISYEGIGTRSFLDWKLRGSIWVTAGYEMNYRSAFTRIEQLKALNVWQQSGLAGICKKYKVSKKFKGSMSLLWDYLSYRQVPRTQPIIFRMGYSIK